MESCPLTLVPLNVAMTCLNRGQCGVSSLCVCVTMLDRCRIRGGRVAVSFTRCMVMLVGVVGLFRGKDRRSAMTCAPYTV